MTIILKAFRACMLTCAELSRILYTRPKAYPIVFCILFIIFLVYKFLPFVSDLLIRSLPVLICTTILLKILLSFDDAESQFRIQQVNMHNNKQNRKLFTQAHSVRRRASNDSMRVQDVKSGDNKKDFFLPTSLGDLFRPTTILPEVRKELPGDIMKFDSKELNYWDPAKDLIPRNGYDEWFHKMDGSDAESREENEDHNSEKMMFEWTENDAKKLMDKNKRLENLIKKRRLRKSMTMQVQKHHVSPSIISRTKPLSIMNDISDNFVPFSPIADPLDDPQMENGNPFGHESGVLLKRHGSFTFGDRFGRHINSFSTTKQRSSEYSMLQMLLDKNDNDEQKLESIDSTGDTKFILADKKEVQGKYEPEEEQSDISSSLSSPSASTPSFDIIRENVLRNMNPRIIMSKALTHILHEPLITKSVNDSIIFEIGKKTEPNIFGVGTYLGLATTYSIASDMQVEVSEDGSTSLADIDSIIDDTVEDVQFSEGHISKKIEDELSEAQSRTMIFDGHEPCEEVQYIEETREHGSSSSLPNGNSSEFFVEIEKSIQNTDEINVSDYPVELTVQPESLSKPVSIGLTTLSSPKSVLPKINVVDQDPSNFNQNAQIGSHASEVETSISAEQSDVDTEKSLDPTMFPEIPSEPNRGTSSTYNKYEASVDPETNVNVAIVEQEDPLDAQKEIGMDSIGP